MLGVDYNPNSVPKVSGTCFGKFEKSTQIDLKMVIFGAPDGSLKGVVGVLWWISIWIPVCRVEQRPFIILTTVKVRKS